MRGRRWEEGEGGREGERGWEEGEGGREGEINLKISTADEEVNCHSLFLLQLTNHIVDPLQFPVATTLHDHLQTYYNTIHTHIKIVSIPSSLIF